MTRRISITALLLLGACTSGISGQYVPRHPNRIYYVVKDGGVQLHKAGKTVSLLELDGAGAKEMFGCDARASGLLKAANSDLSTANNIAFLGVGLLPAFLIRKYRLDGQAELVDAVNVHNDSTACGAR
jgi:hypothetical protein